MRCLSLILILSCAAAAQQPTKRGITPEDYFNFELASDPRVSPDGSQVAYVVSRVDRALNRRIPSLWITRTDGSGAPRQLVSEGWSPSARLGTIILSVRASRRLHNPGFLYAKKPGKSRPKDSRRSR